MSQQHYCAACRSAPASIFCSTDAAFLCTACDMIIHEASKLSPRHTRVPVHLIDSLSIPLIGTPQKAPRDSVQSPNKSSSADTGFDESDESSDFLVPDTDDFPDVHVSSSYPFNQTCHRAPPKEQLPWARHLWTPAVPDIDPQHLASIADAFVKKEAQTLFESSQCRSVDSDLVRGLEMSLMNDSLIPADNTVYSSARDSSGYAEEQQLLPETRFELLSDHHEGAVNEVLGSSLTTEEDSNIPGPDTYGVPKSERTSVDELERSDEQKRLDRQAALRRFRHKRANRSFRKKVRYACRKQLADSRPRVKGRFVGRAKSVAPGRIQKPGIRETAG